LEIKSRIKENKEKGVIVNKEKGKDNKKGIEKKNVEKK